MTIKICPHCGERYVVGFDCKDYIHECNSDSLTLDQEDVTVIGNWSDWSGSGKVPKAQVTMQGAENKFYGKDIALYGADQEDHTRRGLRASTHRQRQHYEYIEDVKEDNFI